VRRAEDNLRGPTIATPSLDAPALLARLDEANIVTSSRDGNMRVMFHADNNAADIDRLIEALAATGICCVWAASFVGFAAPVILASKCDRVLRRSGLAPAHHRGDRLAAKATFLARASGYLDLLRRSY
jgi:hypothetical protein